MAYNHRPRNHCRHQEDDDIREGFGGASNDSIFARGGDDALFANGGNDFVLGEGGNDLLCRRIEGNDTLSGGSGNDWLLGEDNNDRLEVEVNLSDFGTDILEGERRHRYDQLRQRLGHYGQRRSGCGGHNACTAGRVSPAILAAHLNKSRARVRYRISVRPT